MMPLRPSRLIHAALLLAAAGCGQSDPAGDPQSTAGGASGYFKNPIAPQGAVGSCIGPAIPFLTPGPAFNDSPDPFIVWHEGYYYLTYSSTPLEIRSARSLGGLADAPEHVVWPREGTEVPQDSDVETWAPELHRLRSPEDGQHHWYLYYSPGAPTVKQMAVLESAGDGPLGPYRFKAFFPFKEALTDVGTAIMLGGGALDATVFENYDGRLYYLFSGLQPLVPESRLFIAEMENPWTLKGTPVQISYPALPWERVGLPINEAPAVLRHAGKIHLIYSASFFLTDAYALGRITVDETADLLDPASWQLAKQPLPVFSSSPEAGVWGPGHNGFFRSPDGTENWIVYHAYSAPLGVVRDGLGSCDGGVRTARAQKFEYDGDGNPQFGTPVSAGQNLAAPSGDPTRSHQLEEAEILSSSGPAPRVLSGDIQLVGLGGLEFPATAGDTLRLRLSVPDAGLYGLFLRVKTGPDRGAIQMAVRQAGEPDFRTLGGDATAYAESEGTAELAFGEVTVAGGMIELQFTAQAGMAGGARMTLDQLRFTSPDAR